MKKSWLAACSLFLLVTALAACHKPDDLTIQSTYTFTNQSGRQVTFDVYRTKEDYSQQQNRLYRYVIEPDNRQPVVMDVALAYWIDWYSSDYSYNNWESNDNNYNLSTPPPEVNIAAEDQEMIIKPAIQDTARSVLLNGGDLSSKWRCVISNASNSEINGTYELVFRKDFTYMSTFTNASGHSVQSSGDYILNSSTGSAGLPQGFVVYVLNSDHSADFRLSCNTGYVVLPHTGRDTMRLLFQQFSTSQDYPLVRQ